MRQRLIRTDRLTQQILEAGEGPLVLLVHGFPELSISWRAQIEALAEAGFHAVAPDMRGYGGSERPEGSGNYSILHLVGDLVDLTRALGEDSCVVIGHDWGAAVAWHCALMRPDLFIAAACLSVPFQPRRPKGPPTAAMAVMAERSGRDLYIRRFQPDDAHAEFDADPAAALRKMFHAYDGASEHPSTGFLAPGESLISSVPDDVPLPPWLSQAHFAEYVAAFAAGGFRAPLDWYRCLDLNWAQTAWLQDARIRVPAAFMVGGRDPVRFYAGRDEAALKDWVSDLRLQQVVPDAGHWLQQERPDEVNAFLLDFLRNLDR